MGAAGTVAHSEQRWAKDRLAGVGKGAQTAAMESISDALAQGRRASHRVAGSSHSRYLLALGGKEQKGLAAAGRGPGVGATVQGASNA